MDQHGFLAARVEPEGTFAGAGPHRSTSYRLKAELPRGSRRQSRRRYEFELRCDFNGSAVFDGTINVADRGTSERMSRCDYLAVIVTRTHRFAFVQP